jgi:hypothetical protein
LLEGLARIAAAVAEVDRLRPAESAELRWQRTSDRGRDDVARDRGASHVRVTPGLNLAGGHVGLEITVLGKNAGRYLDLAALAQEDG